MKPGHNFGFMDHRPSKLMLQISPTSIFLPCDAVGQAVCAKHGW